MQYFKLGENEVSRVVQGCMRIASKSEKEIDEFVEAAFEGGINFFDHADIYGRGGCEEVFGRFLSRNPGFRDKIYIQTKCGIKPGISFDFTYEHIISSVDKSLARLGTDRIDYLLLHRPDTLFEPEEVARAFSELREKGKVLHFGVSNQHPMQMELLRKYMGDIPLVANQLQMSVAHCPMIDYGINVNIINDFSANRDGGVLEYCRLNDITIQPWSPFQYGFMEGAFIGNERFPQDTVLPPRVWLLHGFSVIPQSFSLLSARLRPPESRRFATRPMLLLPTMNGMSFTSLRERSFRNGGY